MRPYPTRYEPAILFALSLSAFALSLGAAPLFDWDEINFAESAREMLVTGDYLRVRINYQPFFEKPPLFFWLQALSMRLFGVNELAARLPNAFIGAFTVLSLYLNGLKQRDLTYARLLAGLYLASLLPVAYFKSGIIDPTFNFFIYLGLMQWLHFEQAQDARAPWISGFWIGLATLTKGPVALLISGLIYLLYKVFFDRFRLPVLAGLKFALAWALPVMAWYGAETALHGTEFLRNFIQYQTELFTQGVAGHEQPFYYHLLVFLPGCFPMSAFTFRAMFEKPEALKEKQLHRFMLLWFWVVMIVFSIATTKIVHYASLLYFPAVFLSASYLHRLIREKARPGPEVWVLLLLGLLIWGGGASLINVAYQMRESAIPFIKDPLAIASLRLEAGWTGFEWLNGLFFVAGTGTALFFFRQKKYLRFVLTQAFVMLLFVNLVYLSVLPRIARHTQGAPQAFFTQLAGKDVYVASAGYKSYLPYFYAQVKPGAPQMGDPHWIASGPVNKDVYISVQKHKDGPRFTQNYINCEYLYEEGGFVFYRRPSQVKLLAGQDNFTKLSSVLPPP